MNQETDCPSQLPHDFQDKYGRHYGHASSDIYTHCKHELTHTIWKLLLNACFIDAYKHGIVIKFYNDIGCCIFPKFFTYAADYPEKWVLCSKFLTNLMQKSRILLACIKFLETCPCPCCLITKKDITNMESHADMNTWQNKIQINNQELRTKITNAYKAISKYGASINGICVQNLLSGKP